MKNLTVPALIVLLIACVLAEPPIKSNFHQIAPVLPREYGPPSAPGGVETPATTTERDAETIDQARARKLNEKLLTGLQGSDGVYYIYHPTGLLQKVRYSTQNNVREMAFAAKLKYENVEPIAGPVYTYDPSTYVFKRLQ